MLTSISGERKFMGERGFTGPESIEYTHTTQKLLPEFLQARGFSNIRDNYKGKSLTIYAEDTSGKLLAMRVKSCWRPRENRVHSSMQLVARTKGEDHETAVRKYIGRAKVDGITHFLIVQREDQEFTVAALIPTEDVLTIWCLQRDKGELFIDRRNPAKNGSSPTLSLDKTRDPELADVLWGYSTVLDLVTSHVVAFEQLPEEIPSGVSVKEGARKTITVNAYERNSSARRLCIQQWKENCVVCGFSFEKHYGELGKGYIHVHHLKPLGEIREEYELDPVKDLRPVCPNCHAMLHRQRGVLSIEALQKILKKK
jgi:hypothetical protein